MRIDITHEREDPDNPAYSKISDRYIIIITKLRLDQLQRVGDEVDKFIMKNYVSKKIDEDAKETTLKLNLKTCRRVPDFARFLYEIANNEAGAAYCYDR